MFRLDETYGGVRLSKTFENFCAIYPYGRCLLMGGFHLWEGSAYRRCPLMDGVHVLEVSTYGRCLLMGGICPLMEGVHHVIGSVCLLLLLEVPTYLRCPLMGDAPPLSFSLQLQRPEKKREFSSRRWGLLGCRKPNRSRIFTSRDTAQCR